MYTFTFYSKQNLQKISFIWSERYPTSKHSETVIDRVKEIASILHHVKTNSIAVVNGRIKFWGSR